MNGKLSPSGANSTRTRPYDPVSPAPSRLIVILAEADPASRSTLAQRLSQFHCTVLEYATGVEAIEAAGSEGPDAIILGTRLPDTDGLSAIADLKSNVETARLPVIALAPAALGHERADYLAAGAAAFFTKPAGATEIHWAVLRALQGMLEDASTDTDLPLPDAASF